MGIPPVGFSGKFSGGGETGVSELDEDVDRSCWSLESYLQGKCAWDLCDYIQREGEY